MLFAAGMGIGLVFWGVAEPVSHLGEPPYGLAEPGSAEAAGLGMQYSFFHWGLHPWAVYATVALAIAYFGFRRGRRPLISSAFYPLLGDRVDGPAGKVIDVLAVLATLFGVAVSLGLGALQINSGLNHAFEVPTGVSVQITIIAVITVVFLASAATGIQKGIRYLSNVNLVLAAGLLAFVFLLGPTTLILNTFTQMTGGYLGSLVPMSFRLSAFEGDSWGADWTLFYWATWIAWSPYVGTFIARISRGRTIREFVLGVLLVPTLVSLLWFSTFGGTALDLSLSGNDAISSAVAEDEAAALFAVLGEFPLALVTSVVAVLLIGFFFITSADSASFVLGSLSSGGAYNPGTFVKLTWGVVIASFAAVLLLSGGLDALQDVATITAVPFAVVMVFMCWSMLKAISNEPGDADLSESRKERYLQGSRGESP